MGTHFTVFGDGTMPQKELKEALEDVLEDGSSATIVMSPDARYKIIETLVDRDEFDHLVLALLDGVTVEDDVDEQMEQDVDDIVAFDPNDDITDTPENQEALVLFLSDSGTDEPDWVVTAMERCADLGIRMRALNQQLFVVDLGPADEPPAPAKERESRSLKADRPGRKKESVADAEGAPEPPEDTTPAEDPVPAGEPTPEQIAAIRGVRDLQRMTRNDVRKLAKGLHIRQCKDWRSKDAIIDAILELAAATEDDPYDAAEESASGGDDSSTTLDDIESGVGELNEPPKSLATMRVGGSTNYYSTSSNAFSPVAIDFGNSVHVTLNYGLSNGTVSLNFHMGAADQDVAEVVDKALAELRELLQLRDQASRVNVIHSVPE